MAVVRLTSGRELGWVLSPTVQGMAPAEDVWEAHRRTLGAPEHGPAFFRTVHPLLRAQLAANLSLPPAPSEQAVGLPAPSRAPVLQYTPEELAMRRFHFGSTLSLLDRRKFEREFDVRTLQLPPPLLDVWRRNPHIRQVFANRAQLQRAGRVLLPSDRTLSARSPRTKYARRQGEAKTVELAPCRHADCHMEQLEVPQLVRAGA